VLSIELISMCYGAYEAYYEVDYGGNDAYSSASHEACVGISGVIWLVISASIRRRIHPALVDSGDSGYLTFLPPFPSSGVPT